MNFSDLYIAGFSYSFTCYLLCLGLDVPLYLLLPPELLNEGWLLSLVNTIGYFEAFERCPYEGTLHENTKN